MSYMTQKAISTNMSAIIFTYLGVLIMTAKMAL